MSVPRLTQLNIRFFHSRLASAQKAASRFWRGAQCDVRRFVGRTALAWKRQDMRYGTPWRVANVVVVGVIVGGLMAPLINAWWESSRYHISPVAATLTGATDKLLSAQLKYDAKAEVYHFNQDGIRQDDMPGQLQKASVGAANKSNAGTYALDVPADLSRGVTYHDINSQLDFTLVPEFAARNGRLVNGHLVYPLDSGNQAVYTLKNNGLKEDILVPEARQDEMRFGYTLKLPETLQMRLLDDGSGAVGVYSADSSLFGSITYGSDADKAALQKARVQGAKTKLVFVLPAPVIRAASGGTIGQAKARFEIDGTHLAVQATGLKSTRGLITIDPSVAVTSTSDFQAGGNNEGMIDYNTSGQITRGGLTGGSNGAWSSTTDWSGLSGTPGEVTEDGPSTFYNGYFYVVGGFNRAAGHGQNSVRYAPVNSDGTLGTWQTTVNLPVSTASGTSFVAYNGYVYLVGGVQSGSITGNVYYTAVNSNGTLSSNWQATSTLPQVRLQSAAVASNGYLYSLGGDSGGSPGATNQVDVYYALIKGDGSLGSWASTTSLSYARARLSATAYNGYVYIFGGANTTPSFVADVQYAKVNADGTLGSWNTTNSFASARYGLVSAAYNGYAYVIGGWGAGTPNYKSDLQYAQINANGSLGPWTTSANGFTTGKTYAVGGVYNGYAYVGGGYDGTSDYNNMQYTQLDPAGQTGAFATLTNNFTTARALACSVAYNGYLYAIGGSTTDSGNNNVTTVQYTALTSSTGNNGSWSSTTALPVARGSAGCTAHNGYLYVVAGNTGTSSGSQVASVLYTTISSTGALGASWTTSGNVLSGGAAGGKPGVFTYGTSNGTYIYALGGCVSITSQCSLAQYASLNASTGAVGTWTTSGNAMINQYEFRAFAQVGKYFYAFGGHNGTSTAYADVEYTSVNNDGSINAWASTASMSTAIGFTNGTTVNGCIYSVGGENGGGTSQATVQYACPNANGTISAWNTAPSLTTATTDLGVASYNGYIYGVGGWTTSAQATTQFASVNNGGSGSNNAWAATSNGLASGVVQASSASYNGYLYAVGGSDGSLKNTVQYSQMGTAGDLGAFTTDSHAFTTARLENSSVAYNGYLYVLGGYNSGPTTWYGDVQYAPIGSSGGLSGNFATTTSFVTGSGSDTGRSGVCTAAYNGYIYAVGGWDGTADHNDVRYAAINANGSLGSWADSGHNFTNVRSDGGCFVANGYLYILGGNGASNYNDVQSAQINSDGTLGTWNYTASFSVPRQTFISGVSNGFAYIMGGCLATSSCNVGSNELGDTLYAPVLPGGMLGPWQQATTNFTSTYKISSGVGTIYNGYLYAGGGWGSLSSTSVYYASLNSVARTARYSKLIDLGAPMSVSGITYNGLLPLSGATAGLPPVYIRGAGNDGVFGAQTAAAGITAGATSCLATSQNYIRYLEVAIVLDGSGGQAVLPDAAGTLSNVTDFTVNYFTPHPASNIRMRTGRTLQNGNLSSLDICTDNLQLAYNFNEGTGSTAAATRGSSMTLGSAASWATGHTGTGLSSSGGGSLGGYTSWNIGMTNATIMAWCKPTDLTAGTIRPLFGVWAGNDATSSNTEFGLWAQRSDFGTANVLQGNVRVNGVLKEVDGPALTANSWVHLALSYDGTTIRLYVNGSLYASLAASGGNDMGSYFNVLSGASQSYGVVDDVRMYDTALSQGQIAQLMATPVQ